MQIISDPNVSVPSENNGQSVSMSTTSAQSAAVGSNTVRVVATALCAVIKGSNPTATIAGLVIPANTPVLLGGLKREDLLAFIVPTGTGTVYITPIS